MFVSGGERLKATKPRRLYSQGGTWHAAESSMPELPHVGSREKVMLSDAAAKVLGEAGWTADRKVDLREVVERYEACGYEVSASAFEFLESFDGLTLEFPRGGETDCCWFDSGRSVIVASKGWVGRYSALASENVLPVGEMYFDHFSVFVGQSGALYAGYDQTFYRLGETWQSGISNLIGEDGFERLD